MENSSRTLGTHTVGCSTGSKPLIGTQAGKTIVIIHHCLFCSTNTCWELSSTFLVIIIFYKPFRHKDMPNLYIIIILLFFIGFFTFSIILLLQIALPLE